MTGTSRRHTLECMIWAGAGILWTMKGGVPRSALIGSADAAEASFSFVQISDSHLGFAKPPNPDPAETLQEAIALIGRHRGNAGLLIHTGDVSHLSRASQFDDAAQIIGTTGLETHYVPGEHDVLADDGRGFFERFDKAGPRGWYSFDTAGIHFIGLNNVQDMHAGGMGNLGTEQLAWLRGDLAGRSASQPIVVFAHIPLWTIYPQWGWGTDDSAQALSLLGRFGSVTVLNGHIHQVMQKVEGNIAFHTARSTAFPQPAPGTAPAPGPIRDVPPGKLRSLLGVTAVSHVEGRSALALVDTTLDARIG
nr:metallophosphoesterase [uncultured Lichenicoccus sp.]